MIGISSASTEEESTFRMNKYVFCLIFQLHFSILEEIKLNHTENFVFRNVAKLKEILYLDTIAFGTN